MKTAGNAGDKQKAIRALQKKAERVIPVCQSQGHAESRSDNSEEEKHTQTEEEKESPKEPQTQADQQTRGRLYVYDPALPPPPLPHTHTHTHRCAHALRTTHCRADLFKRQELCLSFPTSCSQKYL